MTGTTCPTLMPTKQYNTKKGDTATSMTSAEYVDVLEGIFRTTSGMRRLPKPAIFFHDRDPSHLPDEVAQVIRDHGMQPELLPPRSPDLDPLDYAVFGHSKRWWRRNFPPVGSSWDVRCAAFVKHLEGLDPSVQVAHYVSRLHRVVDEEGGHIEY